MDLESSDDLAQLSEETAVRRRFDERNLRLFRWFLRVFLLVSLGELGGSFDRIAHPALRPISLCHLALVIAAIPLFRRIARGCPESRWSWLDSMCEWTARHLRAAVITLLIVQFLLVFAYSVIAGVAEPWLFLFPLMMMFFRFEPSESLFIYATLLGVPLLTELLTERIAHRDRVDFDLMIAMSVTGIVALGIGLFMTSRFRKSFLAQWIRERIRRREELRMRQELEFAREIQLSMLPRESPLVDWGEIASLSLPATEVGGDYYDYFTTDSGKLAIVIGDVAGHGLASGLVLSGIRSCLTLLASELDRPVSVLERLHKMLRKTTTHRMLVTLSILLIDPRSRKATLTNAGHPPLIVGRSDGSVEELLIPSFPLGSPLTIPFEERQISLKGSEILLLHTDGIYEARDESDEQYGLDRLQNVVARHASSATARSMRDEIVRDLWAFKKEAPQHDDITLVTIRLNPSDLLPGFKKQNEE